MTSIAVIVLLETDDPRLQPGNLDVSTVQKTQELRQAVVDALPMRVTRVVAVMPELEAKLMCAAHDAAAQRSGLAQITRPPKAYKAPASKRRAH